MCPGRNRGKTNISATVVAANRKHTFESRGSSVQSVDERGDRIDVMPASSRRQNSFVTDRRPDHTRVST